MSELADSDVEGVRGILESSVPFEATEQPEHPPDASTVMPPTEEPAPTMAKPAGSLGVPDESFSDIELDANQSAALVAFKEHAGSGWKKKLKQCWKDGSYDDEIDENTRIALEQVKHLVGEDNPPKDVAGDVTGRTKLKIRTEAKKGKFPWEEVGQVLLQKMSEPEMQQELASIAGIDFTSDPEAWAAFWAEFASKFKSAGFLTKAKKKSGDGDKPKPKDDDDEPAPEPEDDEEDDFEFDLNSPELEPVGAPAAAPAPSPMPSMERQLEATDEILDLAVREGGVKAAIKEMLGKTG